jgi:hypothetical protein
MLISKEQWRDVSAPMLLAVMNGFGCLWLPTGRIDVSFPFPFKLASRPSEVSPKSGDSAVNGLCGRSRTQVESFDFSCLSTGTFVDGPAFGKSKEVTNGGGGLYAGFEIFFVTWKPSGPCRRGHLAGRLLDCRQTCRISILNQKKVHVPLTSMFASN